MNSSSNAPQGSTHGPSLGTSRGASDAYRLSGALRSEKDGAITLSPPPPPPTPLIEIQERLPRILVIAAGDPAEQKVELRGLTDKIVQEHGVAVLQDISEADARDVPSTSK